MMLRKNKQGLLAGTRRALPIALLFLFAMPAFAKEAVVIKQVIDGETVELSDGRIVRLIGVSSTNPEIEGSFGRAAYLSKKFIRSTVPGRPVILSYDPVYQSSKNRDSNGRVLAYVWYSVYFGSASAKAQSDSKSNYSGQSEQRLLNGEIIKSGFGFADRTSQYSEKKSFLKYESKAKAAGKGLWQSESAFYEKMLERAKGSREVSVSEYMPPDTRQMSFDSAYQTFSELTQSVPSDYRAFYQRSWLGADPLNDKVGKQNLEDIEKAIALSPNNPKCYVQKHFLLRLLDRHGEAIEAYSRAVDTASKYGMVMSVSYFTDQELEGERLKDPEGEDAVGFGADAFRAGLNEDHFLIFMARYKKLGNRVNYDMEKIFTTMMENPTFKAFHQKYSTLLTEASPRKILYATKWAKQGWDEPEEMLKAMEKSSKV